MKKLMTLLLVLCMLLSGGAAGALALPTEEPLNYELALERLSIISLRDADELDLIAENLKALGDVGFARQYMALADALARLARDEEPDFGMIGQTVKTLSEDLSFAQDYLTRDSLAALPFENLLGYITARGLEAQGKTAEATAAYEKAQALDSLPRSLHLLASKQDPSATLAPPEATGASSFTFKEDSDGTLIVTGYTGSDSGIVIPGFVGNREVKIIGERAFLGNTKISKVFILEGSEDEWSGIADSAFMDCSSLTSVTLASSTRSIGPKAFSGCESLEEVIIPFGLTDISQGSFENCVNLQKIFLPDSLTALGEGAFAGCASLTMARLPVCVTTIDPDAFLGCTSLTIFGSHDSFAQIYAEENGILFVAEDTAP